MDDNIIKIAENSKEIEKVKDRFTLMLERLEEKMDDLKHNMDTGFSDIRNKIKGLEAKIDKSEEELPKKVEDIICDKLTNNKKDKVYKVANWIVVSVLGGAVIVAFGRVFCDLVLKIFGVQ